MTPPTTAPTFGFEGDGVEEEKEFGDDGLVGDEPKEEDEAGKDEEPEGRVLEARMGEDQVAESEVENEAPENELLSDGACDGSTGSTTHRWRPEPSSLVHKPTEVSVHCCAAVSHM